jgi:hypothetical protein
MAENFKAIHTYSDPGFDEQKFYEYDLNIRLSADGLSYCILDINTAKFLHLQSFDLSDSGKKPYIPGEKEFDDFSKASQLLSGQLKWLSNPFNKIRVVINQGKSTLVPDALFNEKEQQQIFEFNVAGGPFPANQLRNDHLKSLNAHSIYHVRGPMGDILGSHFSDAEVFHHSTSVIQALFMKYMNRENKNALFVNSGASRIDMMRIVDKKLEYYNSFIYNTAEDYMYYLIFVVEQLNLNPETLELVMMGEIEKHSKLSELAHKYIRNIKFLARNEDFRYSFVFDQLPDHYYFNLLNASLCE